MSHVVLLIRQIRTSQPPPAIRPSWSYKSATSPPMLYLLESKKSSSSRVPPSLLGNFPFVQSNSKTHRLPGYTKKRISSMVDPLVLSPFLGHGTP